MQGEVKFWQSKDKVREPAKSAQVPSKAGRKTEQTLEGISSYYGSAE